MKNPQRLVISVLSVSVTIPALATSYCLANILSTNTKIVRGDSLSVFGIPNYFSNHISSNKTVLAWNSTTVHDKLGNRGEYKSKIYENQWWNKINISGTEQWQSEKLGSQLASNGNPGFADIVSEDVYNAMFPNRQPIYSYQNLLQAVQQFPTFSNEGSPEQRKREAAAFLANIAHETGGLSKVEEDNAEQKPIGEYCQQSEAYPCVPGPLQLSWNYNYKQAGEALGLDLLNNPDLVKNDGVIGFKTALWFWMTPQAPKPSVHNAMIGGSGFGMTINIINGGVEECGSGTTNAYAQSRIDLYKRFTEMLGVSPGDNLDCNNMKPFNS